MPTESTSRATLSGGYTGGALLATQGESRDRGPSISTAIRSAAGAAAQSPALLPRPQIAANGVASSAGPVEVGTPGSISVATNQAAATAAPIAKPRAGARGSATASIESIVVQTTIPAVASLSL